MMAKTLPNDLKCIVASSSPSMQEKLIKFINNNNMALIFVDYNKPFVFGYDVKKRCGLILPKYVGQAIEKYFKNRGVKVVGNAKLHLVRYKDNKALDYMLDYQISDTNIYAMRGKFSSGVSVEGYVKDVNVIAERLALNIR